MPKQSYSSTLRNTDLYRIFFDLSADSLYVLDRKTQQFLVVNAAFSTMLGYPATDLLNGTVKSTDLVYREDIPIIEALDDPEFAAFHAKARALGL